MSHSLLMALFRDPSAAAAVAKAMHGLGVPRDDLSVVAADHHTESRIANEVGGRPGSEIEDSRTAGQLGELGGLILAAIAIGMPGTGALVAAGPLAAELGEAAGHAAGGLTETLVKAGLSSEDAEAWAAQIKNGSVLLGVHARAVTAAAVETAFARHGVRRVIKTEWAGE